MTLDAPTDAQVLSHAQSHIQRLLTTSPMYSLLIPTITVTHAAPSTVTCHLLLARHHLNSKSSLHGATTATLVDFLGGACIACAPSVMASDAPHATGVSLNIDIQYVGGAKEGETIEATGVAERVGGSVAFTRIVIRKVRDLVGTEWARGEGPLVATGSHTKFVRRK